MKIIRIEREICHKLNVANYETIAPTLRMVAEFEESDDPKDARKQLDAVLVAEWNRMALEELRMVHKRRNGKKPDNDSLPELMEYFKSTLR